MFFLLNRVENGPKKPYDRPKRAKNVWKKVKNGVTEELSNWFLSWDLIDVTLAFKDAITKLVDIDIDIDDVEVKERVGDRLVTADSLVTALFFGQNSELPCTWHFWVRCTFGNVSDFIHGGFLNCSAPKSARSLGNSDT